MQWFFLEPESISACVPGMGQVRTKSDCSFGLATLVVFDLGQVACLFRAVVGSPITEKE